ncbi:MULTISPECIES: hypothetical protein [Acinetobacter calcoaceticus/baumannii complex]|uniref:hypothetical protein n=1 Tax=Acinetobacter calcoaceticus/baumannii complex TaxID=909768 RepID=UPI00396CD372
MTLEICKLCGEKKELQRSHVIGKTVFSRILRNSDGNAATNILIREGEVIQSNDTWESRLLCTECESHFNSQYEDYSIHVLRREQKGVEFNLTEKGLYLKNVDQKRLILYFLSIYWRGSFSNHINYQSFVYNKAISEHLISCFKNKNTKLSHTFAVRVRLLKDSENNIPEEAFRDMLFSPFHRVLDQGFLIGMVYEGYYFELFFGRNNLIERLQPGFLNFKDRELFIPYVNFYEVPELLKTIAQGAKIFKKHDS